MSSPRLGVCRKSMLSNPLHIKAPLGQSRSRGLTVPGPDFTFGTSSSSLKDGGVAEVMSVSCRPSSPLSDLLSHQYGRSWLDEQLNRKQSSITHQVQPRGAAETRTSLLRRSQALPVTHTPAHLSHFTQVSPALDTFREPAARVRAFRLSGGTGRPGEPQGTVGTEPRAEEPLKTNKQ
ncbi:cilia- and flagella-associated protein 77 [Stegastes partitus]|uniref:Cilia- and flagella-associated protein 77 n=1 Tax=Stegastes partitus TaxID=144197 RepID=A0A9Y4ND07_9TELE|nr:PREDICTED: uncharacterized protein C9orf171 homolog [Stegastes partitus]